MKQFQSDTDVVAVLLLNDSDGVAVQPLSGCTVRILDENDNEVLEPTGISLSAPSVTYTVPQALNTLDTLQTRGYRRIELTVKTAANTVIVNYDYILVAKNEIVVLKNSFQPFGAALLRATKKQNLSGWNAASDYDKKSAMIDAYHKLTKLSFRVLSPNVIDYQSVIQDYPFGLGAEHIMSYEWDTISPSRYNSLPERFKEDICTAQILEADNILGSDQIAQKRKSGLISETIGESSQMFKSTRQLDLGLSRDAMECVSKYMFSRVSIGRS